MPQDSSGFEKPAEGQGDGTRVPSPEAPGGASPATAAAQSAYGAAKAQTAGAARNAEAARAVAADGGADAAAGTPLEGAGQPPDPAVEGEGHELLEQDLQELAAKAEKADEYLALAQRLQADFENYRKRAARDAALAQERGIAKLAKELLPAIDNLDRAVQAAAAFSGDCVADPAAGGVQQATAETADSQLVSGIKLVHADVIAALGRVGIESFGEKGEPFDPQHHEAVAQHHVEGIAAGTVIDVYQQGYQLGDTVLRPARVLVSA
jgi:molecular chaperone GrpE